MRLSDLEAGELQEESRGGAEVGYVFSQAPALSL